MDGGGESPVILFVCLLPKSFPPRLQLTRETFFNSVRVVMRVWEEMGPLFRFPNCKRLSLFVILTEGVANNQTSHLRRCQDK